jgi:RNA polymerase sigma-70 factor (ECF subfamily)
VAVEAEDAYLVARAQEGFLDAFEQLVHRHNAAAYRIALRMLGDEKVAQDIAQDVARAALVDAWRNLSQLPRDTSFALWLYGIVSRATLDRLASRHAEGNAGTRHGSTAEGVADRPTSVAAAITALPPAQRIVLVLHHFEGLPNPDVAIITGSTVADTRRLLFRARRTLAAILGQWEVAAQ